MSDSLRPHESQRARPPCPSPPPGVHSDSRPRVSDAICAALNMPANLENAAVAAGLEKVSFHSNPKERQCQCSNYRTIALILHASKWKWSRSVVSDSATPWTVAHQAPPSMRFSRQEYWVAISFSRGIFPTQGWNPGILHCRQTL